MKRKLPKKQENKHRMEVLVIQPWSVPVFRTKLPPDILQTMIEISDQVIANKEAESWGSHLAGQIEKELKVEHEMLIERGVMGFLMHTVRQFVITCKLQSTPNERDAILQEEWMTHMLTMWIVSQQPGEYNPLHVHTHCQISSVMYLKVPKMLPSKKEHRSDDDGSIVFTNSASGDTDFSVSSINFPPRVGDFYIFGAHQPHMVYPYRCEEKQEDVERRSISFNAVFQSKTDLANIQKFYKDREQEETQRR